VAVRPGSQVVYKPNPKLFGVGVITEVLANGRIVALFEHGCEQFDPLELDTVVSVELRGAA
jgi:hypothetical protein